MSTGALSALPRAFGGYTLLRTLGEGGMGEVFLARRELGSLTKLCVIKTLKDIHARNSEYISRFLDEARVVVQLSHKNICHVFDVGKIDGRHYLAMEHVAGTTLSALRSRLDGPLPDAICHHVVGEVLDALDYAHRFEDPVTGAALAIVHRDVSPQNVMISFDGDVKLIDFGLAESQLKVEQTEPQVVLGKIAYMPPEQARGDAVDARCDQFSAAVVGYELFAGERYYGDHDFSAIWAMAGTGQFRARQLPHLDEVVGKIFERALQPSAERRFSTCAEFRDALEDARYRAGLRGGREQLRARMATLFTVEREESRRLLAELSGLSAPPQSVEETLSVRNAPVAAGSSRAETSATASSAPAAAAAPRRWVPVAAAFALAAALAVGVGTQSSPRGAAALAVASDPRVIADAGVGERSPVDVEHMADAGRAGGDAGHLADDATSAVDTGPSAREPLDAGPAPPARDRRGTKRPAPPVLLAPPPSPGSPGDDATDRERYDFLAKACPDIACIGSTTALDDKRRAGGARSDILAFKAALKACVASCALEATDRATTRP